MIKLWPDTDMMFGKDLKGRTMEAVIDLKEFQEVDSISCGFLQRTESWIFLPKQVSFYISSDGVEFTKLTEIENKENYKSTSIIRKEFKAGINLKSVRYIKSDGGKRWHMPRLACRIR